MNIATVTLFCCILAVCATAAVHVNKGGRLSRSSRNHERKVEIRELDMDDAKLNYAIDTAQLAVDIEETEYEVAVFVKKAMDVKYGGHWHCIVGRDFGAYVSALEKHRILFKIGNTFILLFKTPGLA